MYRILMLSALSALAFTACKPTPRTALVKQREQQQAQQGSTEQSPGNPAASPAGEPLAPGAAEPAAAASAAPQTVEQSPQEEVAASLLSIRSTRQDFNRLRPWEKTNASTSESTGIYLGEGRVLTAGSAARAATYLEIRLPDGSRSVPARVLRYDRDLNLALLTPVHEEDSTLFDTRRPLVLGEPLKLGDDAAFDTLVRGLFPVRIPLRAQSGESVEVDNMLGLDMPRLSLRSAQPLPEGNLAGLPVLRDGKLVGMATGGNRDTQSLICINAELIARFLAGPDGEYASAPLIGINYTDLDDPVFRAYLKLGDTQGGLYINEVTPGSVAEQAGLRAGDVVTGIEELPIDSQGRVNHPLYGAIAAAAVFGSQKPLGDILTLTLSRDGEKMELEIPMKREALEKGLPGSCDAPGSQPRYVMWGGLLFQPMTRDYVSNLLTRSKGTLPVEMLEVASREKELLENGVTELVLLTQVIPTPATLSYEGVGYCLVESVNGRPVHNFAEFVQLLDEPTADGLVAIGLNKAPYTIYVDRRIAEAANSMIRRNAIQQLRHLPPQK